MVNYLRSDRKLFPQFTSKQEETMFFKELHYWNVDQEHRQWQEKYLAQFDIKYLKENSSEI